MFRRRNNTINNGGSAGRGRRFNKNPRRFGLGPVGNCVCPSCGEKTPHKRGIPCYEEECPKCDAMMFRER